MNAISRTIAFGICFVLTAIESFEVSAQDEIDILERFAFSADRREVLGEFIPGTEDYFYYHCLHYQNEGQLSEAEAVLTKWRTRFGESDSVIKMTDRQRLLTYGESPERTANYLKQRLRLNFEAAAPQRRGESTYPSRIEGKALDETRLLSKAMQQAPDLNTLEDAALPLLLEQDLNPGQLRAVLGRLSYAGYPRIVDRVIEELQLRDSKGFGWAQVHRVLTRKQLDALQVALPDLNGNRDFVLAYLQRLMPSAAVNWHSREVQADYLKRVWRWAKALPESQRDLKAVAACNLLRFNLTVGKYDQQLFTEYLELPRNAVYYRNDLKRTQRNRLVDTRFSPPAQTRLSAVAQDEDLIQAHLEHFMLQGVEADVFAPWIEQKYLEKFEARTKILFGIGDSSIWYPRLAASEQLELKNRVEIQFPADSVRVSPYDGPLQFRLQIKNLEELIVRVYEIDTAEYYRQQSGPIRSDIDLDGLVPNVEKRFGFDFPSDRRHQFDVDLTGELKQSKRGVWVVDCVGGGLRSRAILRRGELLVTQRVTDFGHRFQVMDEEGNLIQDAEIEIGRRRFTSEDGIIFVPFADRQQTRVAVAIAGNYASTFDFVHEKEQYSLGAAVMLPRQSLISDRSAAVVIRPDLRCVDRRISLALLEEAQLTISATDAAGVTAELVSRKFQPSDSEDLTAAFMVPRRLRQICVEIRGEVFNQSKQEREGVAFRKEIRCNEMEDTLQISQFYVQRSGEVTKATLLGRNGERQSLVPVRATLKHRLLKESLSFDLATNEQGEIGFADLSDVELITLQAKDVRPWSYAPLNPGNSWPSEIQLSSKQSLTLALGTNGRPNSEFALWERRAGAVFADHSSLIDIVEGALVVEDLAQGDYVLVDLRNRATVDVAVMESELSEGILIGDSRIAEASTAAPVVIRSVNIEGGKLKIRADGADELARVHLVANTFAGNPGISSWGRDQLPRPWRKNRMRGRNVYLDSRRLDEEYSYVLNRQSGGIRYGNMLPQPGLLLHPWEVNETKNQSQTAAPGEAMPNEAADSMLAEPRSARQQNRLSATAGNWMSFNFLDQGSYILANASIENGSAEIELDDLEGISEITVLVNDGDAADSRTIAVDAAEFVSRDLRLDEALASKVPQAQSQTVKLITGEKPTSYQRDTVMEVNAFRSLQDVYRLYSTLLPSAWRELEPLSRWPSLNDEEKRSFFNSYACHELNLFLYRKDRPFFESVVLKTIAHKLEKQFVDHWLLGDRLDEYTSFPALQRLNVLERILLVQRHSELRPLVENHLEDKVVANRDQMKESLLFDAALRQSSQGGGADGKMNPASVDFNIQMFGAEALYAEDGIEEEAKESFGRGLARGRGPVTAKATPMMRGSERLGRARKKREELYEPLDKTREWAESQYYRLPLREQTSSLIPASDFWSDYLKHSAQEPGDAAYLPQHMELACNNINEAFAALAVIDLPFESGEFKAKQDGGNTLIEGTNAILYLKTIEAVDAKSDAGIVVGRATYSATANLSKPNGNTTSVDPIAFQTGVPYRSQAIVTNPTPSLRKLQLLTQIPAGAIPLEGSLSLTSSPVSVEPYGTEKVDLTYYFPNAGTFRFAGTRVNEESICVRQMDDQELVVSDEPTRTDLVSWEEIASWGSTEQVVEALRSLVLSEIDLGLVAFRLGDRAAYESILSALEDRMHYEDTLWKFSILHQDEPRIGAYLSQQASFVAGLGGVLNAGVCPVDERKELRFEHLDYKPLVQARSHQLGKQRRILNDGLERQYKHLLRYLAHQPTISDTGKLQVAYYLYLQNRIEESDLWLREIDKSQIAALPQLDYLQSNVDFALGRYEDAASRASGYTDYPLPRWSQMFAEVRRQYQEHLEETLTGTENPRHGTDSAESSSAEQAQGLLGDRRGVRQSERAARSPTLSLENSGNGLRLRYANLDSLSLRFFQMDIELLFSRTPFAVQTRNQRPLIRPNEERQIALSGAIGELQLQIPETMKGKNVLVEVAGAGVSDTSLFTAGELEVDVLEGMGQLRVAVEQGRAGVAGAYVKVYAEHSDGKVRFFKDGYTDLRGRFDYATLSTNELDSVKRFAILVLDAERGAVVEEVKPPLK
ncbi:MAG: hypothetical protein ACE361_15235 [Aureliella sp.]